MNNYARLLVCGLACGPAALAWATPAQQPDSMQQQEQQKGHLWTVAVQQGWPALARQPQWPTKDSLDAWLKNAGDVNVFKEQIVKYVKKTYDHPKALPAELAKALETQLPLFLREHKQPFTSGQQKALHQQLQAALTVNTTTAPANSDTMMTLNENPDAGSAALGPKAESKQDGESGKNTSQYIFGLAGVALGFAAGWLVNKRQKTAPSAMPTGLPPSTAPEPKTDKRKQEQDFLDAVQRPANRPQSSPASAQQPVPSSTGKTPLPKPARTALPPEPLASQNAPKADALPAGSEVSLAVPPLKENTAPTAPETTAPLATVQLFGPSPDVPLIEARKFSALSLPQMPICLRLASAEATTGNFELNPYAEQSRLIGNGIRELRTFFDFDLPLPESFTTLATSRQGTLELRDGSWHLVSKAKIDLT